MSISETISLVMMCIAIVTLIIACITFSKGNKKDNAKDGQQMGQILSDLGYIKAQSDEMKSNQKQQSIDMTEMKTRIAVMESSLSNHVADKSIHNIGVRSPKSK